jgi:predicted NBD/HSP70 family sugar kinase
MAKNTQGPAVPALLREINERRVLDVLRSHGSLHAAEIARLVGLSKPTTSVLLRGLTEVGLVIEETPGDLDSKRARSVYSSVADAGISLGIDIGAKYLRASIADLNGVTRSEVSVEVREMSLRKLLQSLNDSVDRALVQAGFEADHIVSIVVGTPGVVDERTGQIAIAGTIGDLDGIQLGEVIAREYGVTPRIENDINLVAIAEMEKGFGQGVENFAVLSVGSGLGAGLVLGGKLHRGHRGAAGEVFYVPFGDPFDSHHASTNPASDGISEIARTLAPNFKNSILKAPYSTIDIVDAARKGDEFARAIVDEEAKRIALYIAAMAAVVDVELIVLAGGIGRQADVFLNPVRKVVNELVPFPPRIESTTLGDSAVLIGTLQLATRETQEQIFRERSSAIEKSLESIS